MSQSNYDVVTLRTEAPSHRFRATGWIGVPVPAPCTSSGRALLIDLPAAELVRRFAGHVFPTRGPRSRVPDPATLAAVVGEAMVAFVLADALLEKLGGDSLAEMRPRGAALRQSRLADLPMDNVPWQFAYLLAAAETQP